MSAISMVLDFIRKLDTILRHNSYNCKTALTHQTKNSSHHKGTGELPIRQIMKQEALTIKREMR